MKMTNSVSWTWTDRSGQAFTAWVHDLPDLRPETVQTARNLATQMGYPGHKGGWWNYFVEDVRGVLGSAAVLKWERKR